MYCSGCGSPIAPGLSFCNRCGTGLRERGERTDSKPNAAITALVTAMVLVALATMGLMLGGPIALKREGGFGEELIVLFMFLIFFTAAVTEIFLYRQLGRLTAATSPPLALPPPAAMPAEFRVPQPRTLAEPVPSVTENTTRTLEYSRWYGCGPWLVSHREEKMRKLALILIALLFVGCNYAGNMGNGVAGSGVRKSEKRDLSAFTSISTDGAFDIVGIDANGAGKIDAHKLRAAKADVESQGVARVEVFASDQLNVTVSGPSTVIYDGDPNLNQTINGPGSIQKRNSGGA